MDNECPDTGLYRSQVREETEMDDFDDLIEESC